MVVLYSYTRFSLFVVTLFFYLLSLPAKAQYSGKDMADDVLVIGVNSAFYGLIGGVGAAVQKQRFIDGFKKGALGGSIIGTGKFLVGKNYRLGWPARLATGLGSRMVENTVRGNHILQTLGTDIGPVYLEWTKSEDKYKFKPEIWLGSAFSLVISIFRTEAFDWRASLATGSLTFTMNSLNLYSTIGVGTAMSNIVWIPDLAKQYTTYSHEIIHSYQTLSIAPLGALVLGNGWVMKKYDKWHLRVEEDFGSVLLWVPELLLLPNNKMPREL